MPSWKNSTSEQRRGDRRPGPEAVCGGVGRDKITVANGNRALPGRSHRVGVTTDGAENAPRLRVTYGEDSKESKPPLKHRVETHTARAQDSSTPVPERWRSRGARLRESPRPLDASQFGQPTPVRHTAVDVTQLFSLRENAIAKEPGSRYVKPWRCVSRLGLANGGLDSLESSPYVTLSRGVFSASSLVSPIR